MRQIFHRVTNLPRKLAANLRLLGQDPEQFGRNLLQFTNRTLFERRLVDVLHPTPMHIRIEAAPAARPRLNVLDTAWTTQGMTGGPNTVVNLAFRIARHGIDVRLVSTVAAAGIDTAWLQRHGAALLGEACTARVEAISAASPLQPLPVGPRDMFLATHWTTAQQLKPILPQLDVQTFFYMLQEFEPAFYAWSSNFARAIETLGMDFHPIINQAVLADYLLSQPFGRLDHPATRARAIVFEPAVDATLFHPPAACDSARRKRLLFYARPTNTRNLFGLGLMALREAAQNPALNDWEFLAIGSRGSVPELPLGNGHMLRRAPWADYRGYATLLQQADMLLCPMLSPHTSYPVLEMAACGGIAVTNTFATKTRAVLAALSPNIIAAEPTVESFAAAIVAAAETVNAGAARIDTLNLARDWAAALDSAAARIAETVKLGGGMPLPQTPPA